MIKSISPAIGVLGLFLLIVTSVNLSGCKKEVVTHIVIKKDTLQVIDTIYKDTAFTGLYVGTYAVDQNSSAGSVFTSFIFYSDHSVLHKNLSTNINYYDQGTWSISGTTVTCHIESINFPYTILQTDVFTYDSTTNTLISGKWKDDSGDAYTGTFSTLTKNQ